MRSLEFTVLLDRFWLAVSDLAAALQVRESEATGAMLRFWATWNRKQLQHIVEIERERANRDGNSPMPMVCVSSTDFTWRWRMTVGGDQPVPPIEIFENCGFLHRIEADRWRVCGMSLRLGYFLKRSERDEIDDYFTRIADTDWGRAEQLITDLGPSRSRARCAAIGSLAWWRRYIATSERLELAHMEAYRAGHIQPVVRVSESELMRIWKMVTRDTLIAEVGITELAAAGFIGDPKDDERGRRTWAVTCMNESGELTTYAIRQQKRMNGLRGREQQLGKLGMQLQLPGHSGRTQDEYKYFGRYIEANKIRRKVFVPKENYEKIEEKSLTFGPENLTKTGRMQADQDQDQLNTNKRLGDHGKVIQPPEESSHIRTHRGGAVKKNTWRTEVETLALQMAHVFSRVTGKNYLVGAADKKSIAKWLGEYPSIEATEILRTWEVGIRSNKFPIIRNISEILLTRNWNYYSAGVGVSAETGNPEQGQDPGPSPQSTGGSNPSGSRPVATDARVEVEEPAELKPELRGVAETDKRVAAGIRIAHMKASSRPVAEVLEQLDHRRQQRERDFQSLVDAGVDWESASLKRNQRSRENIQARTNRIFQALEAFGADAAGGTEAMLALGGAPRTSSVSAIEQWNHLKTGPSKPRGILLFGARGQGKSFAARRHALQVHAQALSLYYAENGLGLVGVEHSTKMVDKPRMRLQYLAQLIQATSLSGIGNFKESDREYWRRLQKVKTLLIDDLGKEIVNRVWLQNLWELLDARLSSGEQTIITSNLRPQELESKYGSAIYERLLGLCQVVHIKSCSQFEVLELQANPGNLRAVVRAQP